MNRKFTYITSVILFVVAVLFIFFKYKQNDAPKAAAEYKLLHRPGSSALTSEWAKTEKNASDLGKVLEKDPNDKNSKLAMAALFIQEARITGNHAYYDMAATRYVDEVLAQEPANFLGLIFKAIVSLSQHHFAEGLDYAGRAQKVNPNNAYVYGLLVDGHVEMGNYAAAVESSDKMISIRPDTKSYSRISYLREIHGDYAGAIEAMKMAIDAGPPGDEATEWCRVQLGGLLENTGDREGAEMQYTIALQQRPGYGPALAGLGHAALCKGTLDSAIKQYKQADVVMADYAWKEELARIYLLKGEKLKAATTLDAIVDELNKAAKEGEESINHHADKELAEVYLMKGDYDKALNHALAEHARRPDNIDVAETLGWVYHKKGDHTNALKFIQTATRTGSKKPTLLCRAALIHAAGGDKVKAKAMIGEALQKAPCMDKSLQDESRKLFASL
jgi:tetratricopeptide (TPR) repeat protein